MPGSILSPHERRRRRVLVIVFAALLALVAVLALTALHAIVPVSKPTQGLIGVGVLAGVPLAASLWTGALGVAQAAATFVTNPQSQAAAGSMADVAAQFEKLVRSATAGRRRLVIFVEDLDRCPPERAIQICETTSLLLSVRDAVTVLIGDVVALRQFAKQRFSAPGVTADAGGTQGRDPAYDYGRSYFDKIVQLDFSLPPVDTSSLASMLSDRSARALQDRPGAVKEMSAARRGAQVAPPRLRASLADAYKRLIRPVLGSLARAYRYTCERPRRFAAFVGLTFVPLIAIAAVMQAVDPSYHQGDWGAQLVGILGLAMSVAWIAVGAGTVYRWLVKRRTRQSTAKIDETIRDTVASPSDATVETIKRVVAQSVSSASTPLIEQRARRAKVEQLVSEGSGELSLHLPGLPRSVKRVANRHYLLASVAVSRNMVGGTPPLTAQHLSKWALIMERWPEVAVRIIARPAIAAEMEQASKSMGDPDRSLLLEMLPDGIQHREDLICLLQDETSIATVADRLAFALPARA